MANDVNISLLGNHEIDKILEQLPRKLTRKFCLAAWRRSSKPMINAARANIRDYSRSLADSIGNITGRSKKYPTIYVGPRAKGKFKNVGWRAPFTEFGTSGIKRKRAQGYKRESDNPAFAWVGKIKPGSRYRDDQTAKPFMRPAIESTKNQVENNFYNEMRTVLQKVVNNFNKRSA